MAFSYVFLLLFSLANATPSGSWGSPQNQDTSWYSSTTYEFTLNTASQLAGFANIVNSGTSFSGSTIYLGADIDLGEHYWIPIGIFEVIGSNKSFSGSFDGNNHIIGNLITNSGLQVRAVGLFGFVDARTLCTIQNLRVSGTVVNTLHADTNSDSYCGAIVGRALNYTFKNCHSSCTVINGSAVGGIAGSTTDTTFDGCSNSGTIRLYVTKNSNQAIAAGGIVGYSRSYIVIRNCKNTGSIFIENVTTVSVTRWPYLGGLLGSTSDATNTSFLIQNSYNTGDIALYSTSYTLFHSGILGNTNGNNGKSVPAHIQNCYNMGSVPYMELVTHSNMHCTVENSYGRASSSNKLTTQPTTTCGRITTTGTLTAESGNTIIDFHKTLVGALNAWRLEQDNPNEFYAWQANSAGKEPAVFTITVTVTLNPANGAVSPVTLSRSVGDLYGPLPTPTRTGYGFDGWFTSASGGTMVVDNTVVLTEAPHTLYAQWTLLVRVTFNADGGVVTPAFKDVRLGQTYGSMPSPTKAQSQFDGWYSQSGGSGTAVTEGSALLSNTAHSVYAKWVPSYVITFNANGGTVTPASKTVGEGQTYGSLPVAVRGGFYFEGWFTSTTGGSAITDSTPFVVNVDQTLYAQWTASNQINFDANGGTISVPFIEVVTGRQYGTLPVPAKTGYQFTGWYTEREGGVQITSTSVHTQNTGLTLYARYTTQTYKVTYMTNGGSYIADEYIAFGDYHPRPADPVRTGHIFVDWYLENSFLTVYVFSVMAGQDLTLYARWATAMSVMFDASPGTVDITSKLVGVGQPYGPLPLATRTKYFFDGWYTDRTTGNRITASSIVSSSSSDTLYAHWVRETYTISFNSNGGSTVASITSEPGAAITLPTKVKKEGFQFDGWYEDQNFAILCTVAVMPEQNLVLYAKWSPLTDNPPAQSGWGASEISATVVGILTGIGGILGAILGAVTKCSCCPCKKEDENGKPNEK